MAICTKFASQNCATSTKTKTRPDTIVSGELQDGDLHKICKPKLCNIYKNKNSARADQTRAVELINE